MFKKYFYLKKTDNRSISIIIMNNLTDYNFKFIKNKFKKKSILYDAYKRRRIDFLQINFMLIFIEYFFSIQESYKLINMTVKK